MAFLRSLLLALVCLVASDSAAQDGPIYYFYLKNGTIEKARLIKWCDTSALVSIQGQLVNYNLSQVDSISRNIVPFSRKKIVVRELALNKHLELSSSIGLQIALSRGRLFSGFENNYGVLINFQIAKRQRTSFAIKAGFDQFQRKDPILLTLCWDTRIYFGPLVKLDPFFISLNLGAVQNLSSDNRVADGGLLGGAYLGKAFKVRSSSFIHILGGVKSFGVSNYYYTTPVSRFERKVWLSPELIAEIRF